MPKLLHILYGALLAISASNSSKAQSELKETNLITSQSISTSSNGKTEPTHWTYEVKKIHDGEYLLSFTLQLDYGWHIAAMEQKSDALLIPPAFHFDNNKLANKIGGIKENGTLITEKIADINEELTYYKNEISYTQTVKAIKGTSIKGTHIFQVCNDMMCLPPQSKTFVFTLN